MPVIFRSNRYIREPARYIWQIKPTQEAKLVRNQAHVIHIREIVAELHVLVRFSSSLLEFVCIELRPEARNGMLSVRGLICNACRIPVAYYSPLVEASTLQVHIAMDGAFSGTMAMNNLTRRVLHDLAICGLKELERGFGTGAERGHFLEYLLAFPPGLVNSPGAGLI